MDVLTLVHGRQQHLANLISGLERSTIKPACLVIIQINQRVFPWQSSAFPIINAAVQSAGSLLPLAQARNRAAAISGADRLVFLDVDCIPSRDLLETYQRDFSKHGADLIQGSVRYLPAMPLDVWDEHTLDQAADVHPVFEDRTPGEMLPHELFWSLNFACTRSVFNTVGGFDEAFTGYGGEDTDFAFRARNSGVTVYLSEAKAFHQHHPTCSPPLNHLAAIVQNSQLFYSRWKNWPMHGWLAAFEKAGYITVRPGNIAILRMPSAKEIAEAMDGPTQANLAV